jgi:hypothetical protein
MMSPLGDDDSPVASRERTTSRTVQYMYTSSRIGAALVVEPSLTLIIDKFGYLG